MTIEELASQRKALAVKFELYLQEPSKPHRYNEYVCETKNSIWPVIKRNSWIRKIEKSWSVNIATGKALDLSIKYCGLLRSAVWNPLSLVNDFFYHATRDLYKF